MEIRGLASIVWVGGVARIFRLENEGNVTSVAKEIIVLIESTLECVVRTGILSGVAWVGSLERIKRISRMLVVSIFTRVGRVASVYMVTKNSSNSFQARRSMEIRGLASIVWVGGVARIFRLENEGNGNKCSKWNNSINWIHARVCSKNGNIIMCCMSRESRKNKRNKQNVSSINMYKSRKSRKCIVSKLDGVWKSEDWPVLFE